MILQNVSKLTLGDKNIIILWNTENHLPHDKASHPGRLESSGFLYGWHKISEMCSVCLRYESSYIKVLSRERICSYNFHMDRNKPHFQTSQFHIKTIRCIWAKSLKCNNHWCSTVKSHITACYITHCFHHPKNAQNMSYLWTCWLCWWPSNSSQSSRGSHQTA